MTRFAIVTLSRIENDQQSDEEIRDRLLKEIQSSPILKDWKVNKIAIVSN